MKILALDLGTNLGWAKFCSYAGTEAGSIELASKKNLRYAKKMRLDRRLDIRINAFTDWLERQGSVQLCVFEDVKFASYQAQAHLWASFRGVVWAWASRRGMDIDCLDTSKLKLWASGHGGATKEMMAAAAKRRWPTLAGSGPIELDDDGIDALCLLQWAQETYGIK